MALANGLEEEGTMAITRNNPHIRLMLLLLTAALTAWGGAADVTAYAETSDWIWATGGLLLKPRLGPTATLVNLGKLGTGVLLIGGGNETIDPANPWAKDFNPFRSADFITDQKVTPLPRFLNKTRALHTATLLEKGLHAGKILVVGGLSKEASAIHISILEIELDLMAPGSLSTCELFDPKNPDGNSTVNQCFSDADSRFAHTATLLNDKATVLVTGGVHANFTLDLDSFNIGASIKTLNSSYLYNPATGTWKPTAKPLNRRRALHAATLLANGKVLVTGGVEFEKEAKVNLYDFVMCMYEKKDIKKCIEVKDKTYQTVGTSELYDPANDRWDNATSLTQPRYFHTATLLPNATAAISKVLVAGGQSGFGQNSTIERSCEIYNSKTKKWDLKVDREGLPIPSSGHTATLLDTGPNKDKVLLVGGSVDPYASQIYDPEGDLWTLTYDFLWYPRLWHTATLLPGGKVLVAGGPPNMCERYVPPTAAALMQRRVSERAKAWFQEN
jgi:hypothetical protein